MTQQPMRLAEPHRFGGPEIYMLALGTQSGDDLRTIANGGVSSHCIGLREWAAPGDCGVHPCRAGRPRRARLPAETLPANTPWTAPESPLPLQGRG
ncbi:hypothetical protein [Streptomyces massasporeus]|uniref:hypothetical protein n=1 Tax=Streptomyces massasporeus TaxID=67324 RepID=UPI0038008B7C